MIVNWRTGPESWAFRNLARHVQKELPEIEHVENNEDLNSVNVSLTPHDFKKNEPDNRTIVHIDSNRWYEQFIKEIK